MTQLSASDKCAIHELYARMVWALDTADTEAYMALFASDAETREEQPGGFETRQGRAAIRERVLQYHANPDFAGPQHQMAQFVFEPDPLGRQDHCLVRSYAWSVTSRPPGLPHIYWCGHVCDVLVKRDGRWLFREKEIAGWSGAVLARFDPAQATSPRAPSPRT